MKVPFLDLKAQYLSIRDEIHEAINQVLESTAFAGGLFVAKFEEEFARFLTKAYQYLDLKKGSFPVAESAAAELISLPMFPEFTDDQISFTCDCIKDFYK